MTPRVVPRQVRADKQREVRDGHDGTWVAHPALVTVALEVFNQGMPAPNQIGKARDDVQARPRCPAFYRPFPSTAMVRRCWPAHTRGRASRPLSLLFLIDCLSLGSQGLNIMSMCVGRAQVGAADLLTVPKGPRTEACARHNCVVGVQYLEAWLGGLGCVPLYHLMEDAATAEICRTQARPLTEGLLAVRQSQHPAALLAGIVARSHPCVIAYCRRSPRCYCTRSSRSALSCLLIYKG